MINSFSPNTLQVWVSAWLWWKNTVITKMTGASDRIISTPVCKECHSQGGWSRAVAPKLFLIAYPLCVPYWHYVPPCSRKSESTIRSKIRKTRVDKDATWRKRLREIITAIFSNQQVHTNSGIYEENQLCKSYDCEYICCEEKHNLGLFPCHIECLRVPLVVHVP